MGWRTSGPCSHTYSLIPEEVWVCLGKLGDHREDPGERRLILIWWGQKSLVWSLFLPLKIRTLYTDKLKLFPGYKHGSRPLWDCFRWELQCQPLMSHFNGHYMSLQMLSGFPVEWLEAVGHFRGLAKGTGIAVGKMRTGDALSLSGLPQGGVTCSRGMSMIFFSKSEEESLVKRWLSWQKEDLWFIHDTFMWGTRGLRAGTRTLGSSSPPQFLCHVLPILSCLQSLGLSIGCGHALAGAVEDALSASPTAGRQNRALPTEGRRGKGKRNLGKGRNLL